MRAGKITLISGISAVFAFSAIGLLAADPEKLVWGGGNPATSSYSGKYVPLVVSLLGEKRLDDYAWGGESQGTVDNAEKVTMNPTNLALGQLDILSGLNGKPIPGKSGQNYQFTIIHKNMGPECLYLVTRNPNYKTFGHVLANSFDLTIATGGPKSGSFGTYKELAKLYKDLNDVRVVHAGGIGDIVSAAADGKAHFGFFVMRPDPSSEVFKTIKEKGLTLVPVVEFELETSGSYRYYDLKISYGGLLSSAKYHTTACTSVALITGDMASVKDERSKRRLAATIERLQQYQEEEVQKRAASLFGTWRDFADSFRATAADQVKALAEATKEAAKSIR